MNELPRTGRKFTSSKDCRELVRELILKRKEVAKEAYKRHRDYPIPQKTKEQSVAVTKIFERHGAGFGFHYESEEAYIKDFGDWLREAYCDLAGHPLRPWDFRFESLRQSTVIVN